jgi:hypothetical protein
MSDVINHIKGTIYCVKNDVDGFIYIGSTERKMSLRWADHRSDCISNYKGRSKFHQHMRKIGREHFSYVILETYECQTSQQLKYREGEWQDFLKPELNTVYQCISEEDKKARIKASITRSQQRPEYKEWKKTYNSKAGVRERARELDRKRSQTSEYKEKRNARAIQKRLSSVQYDCLCGGRMKHHLRWRHFNKTDIHREWAQENNELNSYNKALTLICKSD